MNNLVASSRPVNEPSNYQVDVTNHGVFLTKINPSETHDLAEHQQVYLHPGEYIRAVNQKSWYVVRNNK